MHWGLNDLRKELGLNIVSHSVMHGMNPSRKSTEPGGELRSNQDIEGMFQNIFRSIGEDGKYDTRLMYPIIDSILDVSEIFIQATPGTGTSKILYHGDDDNTPDFLTYEKGQTISGGRFTRLNKGVLDECRDQVSGTFPVFDKFWMSPDHSEGDKKRLSLLKFFFIDILVSVKTNSRLITFNPTPDLSVAASIVGPDKFSALTGFFDLFERLNGEILTPSRRYGLAGLDKADFFTSKEFLAYCGSHDMLNGGNTQVSHALHLMESSSQLISERYSEFVDQSATHFLVAKGAEKLLDHATLGAWGEFQDGVEIILRLCHDYDRQLTVYTGTDMEKFCRDIVMRTLFTEKPGLFGWINQGIWQRVKGFFQRSPPGSSGLG